MMITFYQSIKNYMIDEKADSRLVDKLNRFIQDIQKYQNYSQSHRFTN